MALRFIRSAPRFLYDFREAIVGHVKSIYAIARKGSGVTAQEFLDRLGSFANVKPVSKEAKALFDHDMIEEAFFVDERLFDTDVLRSLLRVRLRAAGVEILVGSEVQAIARLPSSGVSVSFESDLSRVHAQLAYNCAYANANLLLSRSGLPVLPLTYELTELALFQVPPELEPYGITVVDGDFFSLLPCQQGRHHCLSHVIHTRHELWDDETPELRYRLRNPGLGLTSRASSMIADASRFVPALRRSLHTQSIFEAKVRVSDASRGAAFPMVVEHWDKTLYTILGGKLDNVYELEKVFARA